MKTGQGLEAVIAEIEQPRRARRGRLTPGARRSRGAALSGL